MPRHFKNQFVFILFGIAKSGKSLFANLLFNKLTTEFPMDKTVVLNNDDMDNEPPEGGSTVCFLRDIKTTSAERKHTFIIIDDLNLTLDQITAILMVIDNHPKTGVLLIDMGKVPDGVLSGRSGVRSLKWPSYQDAAYALTKSKLPASLPTYKIRTPSHTLWSPDIVQFLKKREIYEKEALICKEEAVDDITQMIKTNPTGFMYHIFDTRTPKDSFFRDHIIDGFLKRTRFSYMEDVRWDRKFYNGGEDRTYFPHSAYPARRWLDNCSSDPWYKMANDMDYMNKHDYMRDKLKIPKVDLTSAFDKAAAEKDLEDAEWTSLLSGEPSLSGPPQPPTFGDKKKDSPVIDLTKSSSTSYSAVSTPEISDEGEKEEEDKLAESMVKSLLIERDEDKDDEEEKPISTPENANN